MSHHDYVRPSGQWPPETVLTPGDLRRFDVAQFQALNGDAGGTWAPFTPITIGGLGLALQGGSSVGHKILGGVQTYSGGRIYLGTTYPVFETDVTREISYPIVVPGFASMNPVGSVFATVASQYMTLSIPPRQVHNGATLSSVSVAIQVGAKHVAIPQFMPSALLVRDDWYPWNASRYPAGAGPTAVVGGEVIFPSNVSTTGWGLVYVATTTGTTSGTEPTWSSHATINSSVTDGSVTWTATGYSPATAPAWAPSTAYTANHNAYQPTAANGLLYVPTAISGSGTSGTTEPTWPMTVGATVIDNPGGNQVTWTCVGSPRPAAWTASTAYAELTSVSVSNGFVYKNLATGTSGSSPPAWGTTVGGFTTDGTCNWLCEGTNPIAAGSLSRPATADAYFDGGVTQTMTLPCYGSSTVVVDTVHHSYSLVMYDEFGVGAFQSVPTTTWAKSTAYVGDSPSLLATNYVQPTTPNGYYYMCNVSGTSSSSTQPTWTTVLGALTATDGSTQWKCIGANTPSNNAFLSLTFSFGSIADMRPE
jgi:hypothetical protein